MRKESITSLYVYNANNKVGGCKKFEIDEVEKGIKFFLESAKNNEKGDYISLGINWHYLDEDASNYKAVDIVYHQADEMKVSKDINNINDLALKTILKDIAEDTVQVFCES